MADLQYDAFHWTLTGTELSPRYPPASIETQLATLLTKVGELHTIKGLDAANPVAGSGDGIASKTLTASGITLTITPDAITRT